MDEQRRGQSICAPRRVGLSGAAFLSMLAATSARLPAAEADSIRLSAAAEQGTFNVGSARATFTRLGDPYAGGDILKLDYVIPPGTAAGVYAKAFPAGLSADQIDIARLAVKATKLDQAQLITAAIEVKGTAGVQRIPLEIHSDWTPVEQPIDWPAIGTVKEVVLLVNCIGNGEPATGTLLIDARFERLPMLRKLSLSPGVRFTAVLLASLLAALVTALLRWALGGIAGADDASRIETLGDRASQVKNDHWQHLLGDLVRSIGVVLIALLVIETFFIGDRSGLETGWTALGLAIAGTAVAAWWQIGLTGRHLTVVEAFQDMLVSGLLATSASSLGILQAPTSWSATLPAEPDGRCCHHVDVSRDQRLPPRIGPAGTWAPPAAALIVGTPYVVGGLVLLESNGLLQSLGTGLSWGSWRHNRRSWNSWDV